MTNDSAGHRDENILEQIRQFSRKQRDMPESQRTYVTRPEKYDYPIGIDPQGEPYPLNPDNRQVDEQDGEG